jgi:sporulation protein YlmC with PRC-barrel domain
MFTAGLLALCLVPQSRAQVSTAAASAPDAKDPKQAWSSLTEVEITTMKGEPLGRITDLALDLPHGRIVEVLVVSGQFLRWGGKTVAVPPDALYSGKDNTTFLLDMTAATFKGAPVFETSKWAESTQIEPITATFQYFGQTPHFLETGEAPGRKALSGRPLEKLTSLQSMNALKGMKVYNLQNELVGELQSFVFDIPHGHISNVDIWNLAGRHDAGQSNNDLRKFQENVIVVPATLLSLNAKGDGLLLDVSKLEQAGEPNVAYEFGPNHQIISSQEEPATGPHTRAPLAQGTSFRDIRITAQISDLIKQSNLDAGAKVEVGTSEGRVTLRGPVDTQLAKDKIAALAVSVVSLDNVDNQIVVAGSLQASL